MAAMDAGLKAFNRPMRADDAPIVSARSAQRAGGTLVALSAGLGALWIVATIVTIGALAPGGLGGLSVFQGAALFFMAVTPAALLVLGGFVAREGARARVEARRLADAGDRMMNPSPTAEAAARRLGMTVRAEIVALDRALDEALTKLGSVEEIIRLQSAAVDKATSVAQQGAGHMVSGLERERESLLKISEDLERRTQEIVGMIGRQSHGIADAATMAEARLRGADDAITARIASFGAAASLISEKSSQLERAAASTAGGAQKLESVLATALDALTQAARLTDTAKQSVETATGAAQDAAGAARETTARVVDEARRMADIVRAEAQTVEREANAALTRLRELADGARAATIEARESLGAPAPRAPERPQERPPMERPFAALAERAPEPAPAQEPAAEREERSLSSLLATSRSLPPPPASERPSPAARAEIRVSPPPQSFFVSKPPTPEAPPQPTPLRVAEPPLPAPDFAAETFARFEAERLADAAPLAPAPRKLFGFLGGKRTEPQEHRPRTRESWTWRDLFGGESDTHDDGHDDADGRNGSTPLGVSAAPNDFDFYGKRPESAETVRPKRGADLVAQAGLSLDDVFEISALDRIASRARSGAQSRRRAVRDAAPDAVSQLTAALEHDDVLRSMTANFLQEEGGRIADLLGRGRASMSADSTRAFLLLDAAAA